MNVANNDTKVKYNILNSSLSQNDKPGSVLFVILYVKKKTVKKNNIVISMILIIFILFLGVLLVLKIVFCLKRTPFSELL